MILCVDIGTSSLKAALFDESANIIASEKIFYINSINNDAQDWLDAFRTANKSLFRELPPKTFLKAISISGNGPTLVTGGKTFLWNIDEPNARQPSYTGASIFVPRLEYIKLNYPEIWATNVISSEARSQLISGPEYVAYVLTGNAVTILPEARYESAYWTCSDLEFLSLAREKLPPFAAMIEPVGVLSADAAEKIAIPHKLLQSCGTKVFCTGPDFIAAMIGTNTLKPGKAYNRTGTSEGINLCSSKPLDVAGIRCLPSVIAGLWNLSVLFSDTGKKFNEYTNQYFPNIDYSEAMETIASNPNTPHHKKLVAHFEQVKEKLDFLQAKAKAQNIAAIESITVTGSQSELSALLQLKADILQLPLSTTTCSDAELMGDFIVASTGCGVYHSLQDAAEKVVRQDKVFAPSKIASI